jgi:enoyl-CoA hydratase
MTAETDLKSVGGDIVTWRNGPVQWLMFNRPHARNAMTFAMYDQLIAICEQVDLDRDVRALVLTGAGGKAFVAGTDISQFRAFATEQDALDYEDRGNRVMATLERVRVPTIVAIAGSCTGGGAAIAASCDLRIASPSAQFGFPIARTLGNCLSMPNYVRLAALLGIARTKVLLMTARLISAPEMLAVGLVSEVVPDEGSLWERAQELAEEVAGHAPLTLWATKEALRRIREQITPPPGADRDMIVACYMSRDFKEGVESFLSKRPPKWLGE